MSPIRTIILDIDGYIQGCGKINHAKIFSRVFMAKGDSDMIALHEKFKRMGSIESVFAMEVFSMVIDSCSVLSILDGFIAEDLDESTVILTLDINRRESDQDNIKS